MSELAQHISREKAPSYRTLTISSNDLVNGVYRLPAPIQCRGVRIYSIIVANSWRTVDSSNDTFVIGAQETGSGWLGNWYGTFVLRHGNYNASSLATEMSYQLNSGTATWTLDPSSTGTPPSKPDGTWTVNVGVGGQSQDPRFYITNSSGSVKFTLVVAQSSAAKLLGFTTTRTPYYTYWGDQLPQLNRVTVLNINSNELGSRLFDNMHSSFPLQSSIVWTVPVMTGFGNVMEYHTNNPQIEYWNDAAQTPEELSIVDFTVCGDDNKPIDFQGVPFYIKLMILV